MKQIICYGDSNTFGYDPRGFFGGRYDEPWPELLPGSVQNRGENGREIPRFPVDFSTDADLLIVMLGTNDLLQGNSVEAVTARMERFLTSIPLDKSQILLVAPPPMKLGEWVPMQVMIEASKALARSYQILAQRLGIRFADAGEWNIPLAFDGVHFTQEGHRAFALELTNYLEKENISCWKLEQKPRNLP